MEFKDIVGKTIQATTHVKRPAYDDEGWLLLEFTDGSKCIVHSWYSAYTGQSEDEYPTGISITDETDGFVPVDPSA